MRSLSQQKKEKEHFVNAAAEARYISNVGFGIVFFSTLVADAGP